MQRYRILILSVAIAIMGSIGLVSLNTTPSVDAHGRGGWRQGEPVPVDVGADQTTFDIGIGSFFKVGSNTTATAITDVTGGVPGKVFTLIAQGGANYSTIAGGGNFDTIGGFGWTPDSANDNITFVVIADNNYVQINGTATNHTD